MMPLAMRRRFYAEEIEATSHIASAAVVDALATVPRERFLGPGPWTVRGENDFFQIGPFQTPDADPRHVYHNLSIALDPSRQLFNGAPGFVAMVIDRLGLRAGETVVHIGCGTGYYTALMAHCVGARGRVTALEVDPALAQQARANLADFPWVSVRADDGRELDRPLDAIFVNAGVTHPLDGWLDALAPGGRLAVPLTISFTPTIGKGLMLLITRGEGDEFAARVVGFVAIYNAVGIRDEAAAQQLGGAMKRQPLPPLQRLRRDVHSPGASCWLHRDGACLSTE